MDKRTDYNPDTEPSGTTCAEAFTNPTPKLEENVDFRFFLKRRNACSYFTDLRSAVLLEARET